MAYIKRDKLLQLSLLWGFFLFFFFFLFCCKGRKILCVESLPPVADILWSDAEDEGLALGTSE